MWRVAANLKMNSGEPHCKITAQPTADVSTFKTEQVNSGVQPIQNEVISIDSENSKDKTNATPIGFSLDQYFQITDPSVNQTDQISFNILSGEHQDINQLYGGVPKQQESYHTPHHSTWSSKSNNSYKPVQTVAGSNEKEKQKVKKNYQQNSIFNNIDEHNCSNTQKVTDNNEHNKQNCGDSKNSKDNNIYCNSSPKHNKSTSKINTGYETQAKPVCFSHGIHPTSLKIWYVDTKNDAQNKHAQFLEKDLSKTYHCPFDEYHVIKKSKYYCKHVKKCYVNSLEGYNGKLAKEESLEWIQCKYDPTHLIHKDYALYHYYHNCSASK